MNHNECIARHLKGERWKRNWSQALVCSNLNISIRTLSRAENGKGISKTTLKKLCSLYQIPISQMYMDVIEKKQQTVDLIPDDVAVRLLCQSTFVGDIQREAVLRFNDAIQKNAVMLREDIEAILPDVINSKKSYSLADIISCCMAVNQRTVRNIINMALT